MSGLPLPVSKRIGGAVSAARNGKKATASLFENEPVQEGVILDNLHVAATATAVLVPDSATVSGGQQHVADSSVCVNTSPLVANRDTIITDARNADAVCKDEDDEYEDDAESLPSLLDDPDDAMQVVTFYNSATVPSDESSDWDADTYDYSATGYARPYPAGAKVLRVNVVDVD
jgi:hypothetical protein